MLFGMTRGEIGLVLFVFALIYAGVLVPRLGERVGVFFAGRQAQRLPSRRASTKPDSKAPPTGGAAGE